MKLSGLWKRNAAYFGNAQLFQLLLKYNNQTHLTAEEGEILEIWAVAHKYRHIAFKELNEIIELQKELSSAKTSDIMKSWEIIKEKVPEQYINPPVQSDWLLIRQSLLLGLKNYGNELVLGLIKGEMWGKIYSVGGILVSIILVIGIFIGFALSITAK